MLPTEGSASPFPESQLCSRPPQAVTPRSSTHLTLDDLRQLLQLREASVSIMRAALFYCLEQMLKGRQHLALIILVESEIAYNSFFFLFSEYGHLNN